MKRFYMIGNTHFDPVWLWRWDEAMASIRATFRSALDRMKEDENFIYSFATPPVFEWIKKTDPEMFEEIRQRVSEGRWELAEGWWVQPDCYGASGESYIRHGLYGQRYLKENFGIYADCVFNIDSFGHSPMLPQILKKSGIDYYCFVRPEKHHIPLENPLFHWVSADGSSVLAYRADNIYLKSVVENFEQSTDENDEMIVYGVTDHGGAPTRQAIADINACENAVFSTVSGFFKSHSTGYTFKKELTTGDFGPYANYSRIKKLNRIAEYAVLNAEKASLIADRYNKEALTSCWKDILFNQFHDILGGACIKDAYSDAENMLGRAIATANEIIHFNLQSVTRNIKMIGKNPDTIWNVVVWNLNGVPYNGLIEAEVQWAHEFDWYDKGLCLEDADGNRYPCQIIREKSVIPRFRSRFIFKAEIPAVGYKIFKLIQTGEAVAKKAVDPFVIQTNRLTVEFSEDGLIRSVTDRATHEKLSGKMLVPACYDDLGDTWCFNIEKYENIPHRFEFKGFQLIESGDLLTEIKAVYVLGRSSIEMYYRFYADEPYFDVRYRVNWEEKHKVLKLETDINPTAHTAAVPAGTVERNETAVDVPLGAWVDFDGITFVPNAIFAYNAVNGKCGLTVLRSPVYGDFRLGELNDAIDYDIIDRGIVEGGLRVCFGGNADECAAAFNNSPVVIDESNHEGYLPPAHSFYGVHGDGVLIDAIKKCEDDDSEIIRFRETKGKDRLISFTAKGKEYETKLKPFEIKTLKIQDGVIAEVDMIER